MKTLEQIRAINESRIEPEVGESSKYLKYSDLMKAYAVSFAKDGGLGAASKKIKAAMEKEKKKLGISESTLTEGNKRIEVPWDMGDPRPYQYEWQDSGVYLDDWDKRGGSITIDGAEKDLMNWLLNDYDMDKKEAKDILRKGKKIK